MRTAHHVVYNTDEAKKTVVDLFYDDESFRKDGTMQSVQAFSMCWSKLCHDASAVLCVTHDETVSERVTSLNWLWKSLPCGWYSQSIIRTMNRDGDFADFSAFSDFFISVLSIFRISADFHYFELSGFSALYSERERNAGKKCLQNNPNSNREKCGKIAHKKNP